MPGKPHTIATSFCNLTGIYDDGVLRPETFSGAGLLAFGSDSTLFVRSGGSPGSNIYRLAVDANGVILDASGTGATPPNFFIGLTTGFGEVINPNGQVIDPNSLSLVGSLTGQNLDEIISVDPDESVGRIFAGSYAFLGLVNSTAYAFDPLHFQVLGTLNIPRPNGTVRALPRLLRWGRNGIVFQERQAFSVRRSCIR